MSLPKRKVKTKKNLIKNTLYWEKDPDVLDGNKSPMMNSTSGYKVHSSKRKSKED
jgi:hypothetical protein